MAARAPRFTSGRRLTGHARHNRFVKLPLGAEVIEEQLFVYPCPPCNSIYPCSCEAVLGELDASRLFEQRPAVPLAGPSGDRWHQLVPEMRAAVAPRVAPTTAGSDAQ